MAVHLLWGPGLCSSVRYLGGQPMALDWTQIQLCLCPPWACVSDAHPDYPGKASLAIVSKQNLSCLVSLK